MFFTSCGNWALTAFTLIFLAEVGEKDEYICHFLFYILEFFYRELAGLLGRLPEEVFKQFPGLNGEGFGEVLGVVELSPVALVPK